jgi:hypothetical protein
MPQGESAKNRHGNRASADDKNTGKISWRFPCYLQNLPCYRKYFSLLFCVSKFAKIKATACKSNVFPRACRRVEARAKFFPVFFPVICAGREQSSSERYLRKNSHPQFGPDVEVSGLETETAAQRARAFPVTGLSMATLEQPR